MGKNAPYGTRVFGKVIAVSPSETPKTPHVVVVETESRAIGTLTLLDVEHDNAPVLHARVQMERRRDWCIIAAPLVDAPRPQEAEVPAEPPPALSRVAFSSPLIQQRRGRNLREKLTASVF